MGEVCVCACQCSHVNGERQRETERPTVRMVKNAMEWPADLESKVVGLCVAGEDICLAQEMRTALLPVKGGSTQNAFFLVNESLPPAPQLRRNRAVRARVPACLHPLYATYDDTVEFAGPNGLVFLSERQILDTSPTGTADIAYRYCGMGHVTVHTYVPNRAAVVSMPDGGSNGYERADNAARRKEAIGAYVRDDTPIASSDPWVNCRPLLQWWREESGAQW